MITWQMFWTALLGISVLLFLAVEIVVVIGGALDIGSMLRSLRRRGQEMAGTEGNQREDTSFCPPR